MPLKVAPASLCVLYILILRGALSAGNSNSYESIPLPDSVRGLKSVSTSGKTRARFDVFHALLRITYSCEFNSPCRMWMRITAVHGFVGPADVMS